MSLVSCRNLKLSICGANILRIFKTANSFRKKINFRTVLHKIARFLFNKLVELKKTPYICAQKKT